MSRASALAVALEEYDGKHTDVLKELRDELEPTAVVLRQAVKLSVHKDVLIAQGATWLLWEWLSIGAKPTARIVLELVERLPRLLDKWVLLHVVRCLPLIEVAPEQAAGVGVFLQRCCGAELPFLRAWGMDSLHRLALQHDCLSEFARCAREAARDDPAPSVRKRLQMILRGC